MGVIVEADPLTDQNDEKFLSSIVLYLYMTLKISNDKKLLYVENKRTPKQVLANH